MNNGGIKMDILNINGYFCIEMDILYRNGHSACIQMDIFPQINIILPLSGRLQTFQRFMTKLTTVILPHDRRIFLTVVYFGDDGLQRARNIITRASREANFRKIKLLTLNETFSRGKALQVKSLGAFFFFFFLL